MTGLKELQESFQKALLEGDLGILSQIPDSPREKKRALLNVYQFAYGARLQEFLEVDFPQLHAYLGDEQFAALLTAYIEKHPSKHPNARWFGERFPAFVKETQPYAEMAQLGEIAALDHTLNSVFDEVDAAPLKIEQLAEIPPENWTDLTLQPISAVHHLTFSTNAADIWIALEDENDPPELVQHEEIRHILVYRHESKGKLRPMSYEEAMMWDKMTLGVPFGVLCELVATYGGEEEAAMRAAAYLQNWVMSELILDDLKIAG